MIYKKYHNIFFLGIGGIGMSALAKYFNNLGYSVFGYDKTETELTKNLSIEGISIHYEDDVDNIPWIVREDKENSLVVYTPAIPQDNNELEFFKAKGYAVKKRSEVLGWITEGKFTIAVAGTHGKTTTSSMLAHIFKSAGQNVQAFVGGLTVNYQTNFITGEASDKEMVIVVEADEYDRSFLTLHPDIAILTSIDADHLDIYKSKEALKKSFEDFVNNITDTGRLIVNEKLKDFFNKDNTNSDIDYYGNNRGQFFASNISMKDGFFIFDLYAINSVIRDVKLGVPGFYNVENAVAAAVAAYRYGISFDEIKNALETYKGVKRRFEFVHNRDGKVYIDDYAHHPEEINAFLGSLRKIYPNKNITAIFQPHLFSRTRDFADEFAASLDLADYVFLMDIYPARELPIKGVNSSIIADKMKKPHQLISRDEILSRLDMSKIDILVTIGAGDIDKIVNPIKAKLLKG